MTSPVLTRRTFAAGALGLALAPSLPALAAGQGGMRRFVVLRGDEDIGTHTVTVQRNGTDVTAKTDIDIAVKRLGFTLYRYELTCTEVYGPAGLISLNGQCNDDGDSEFVSAAREGERVMVRGSSYEGPAPAAVGTTTYWRRDALSAAPWISPQSGELLSVTASPVSVAEMPAGATAFRITNGTDYTVDTFYDSRGEWIGSAFDAKGERATIRMVEETGVLQG
jgi:hypothetical protein